MIIKNTVKNLMAILVLYIMLTNSQMIVSSVKNGMLICYNSIIPSLFLFIALANYISQDSFISFLSIPLRPYSRLLKCENKSYPAYLLLSLFGGLAVCATLIDKMQQAKIDKQFINVASVSMICNSMAFCVFGIGLSMLNNTSLGIMLYISQCLANLITAFIISFFYKYSTILYETASDNIIKFTDSVNYAVNATLSICGYVILFYSVCEVVMLYTKNQLFTTIISIIFEVTAGCINSIKLSANSIYFVCAALSVVPVSSLCQIYSFTENPQIIKTLILSRFIHTPLSLCILSVLLHLFPVAAMTNRSEIISVKAYQAGSDISFVMFSLSFIFIILIDKNKLFTKF